MNQFLGCLCMLFVISGCVTKQNNLAQHTDQVNVLSINPLQKRFQNADSVILISHVLTKEYAFKIVSDSLLESTKKQNGAPAFLINGIINPAIVKEKKVLNKNNHDRLVSIFSGKIENQENYSKCFFPHHSILLYNQGHESYIDICFSCQSIYTSSDITLPSMDEKKWAELKKLFISHNLTYSLDSY